jgi:Predicted phosphohydrolases
MSRLIKKTIKRIVILLLIILMLIGTYVYSRFIVMNMIKINRINYQSEELPEAFNGFKIGFISDIYIKDSSDLKRLEDIVNNLNKQNCDLVIFGGDLYESATFEQNKVSELLTKVNANYGKFAVLGEKDFIELETSISILENGGFEVLRNTHRPIYYNGSFISLLGLESNSDISQFQNNLFTLAIIHEPDYFTSLQEQAINLQISGHTNGGYVYIPFIGALNTIPGGLNYNHGTYKKNNKTLIVSNGLGMEKNQKYRFFATPEILVINLSN